MTRSSDLVMVEREVLLHAIARFECLAEDFEAAGELVDWAMCQTDAQKLGRALQSVEGGVQGSSADGQQCNEQSGKQLSPALRAYRSLFEPPESDAYDNLTGALYDIKRHIESGKPTDDVCVRTIERVLDQLNAAYTALRSELTKTPSADHDAGNLRGLAEPNHQPHAVSQGWRDDMENAPKEDPNCPGRHFEIMVAGGKYFTTADDWRTRYDHPGWSLAYWDGDGWCGEADEQYGTNYYYEPTHWMLKVAPPPSPENTPRDSSESTTGGAR